MAGNGPNSFRSIVECPVCCEVLIPPIYQCITGHSFCNVCKTKLNKCPLCKSRMSADTRNFLVEELVLTSSNSCAYEDEGCPFKGTVEVLDDHIENCQYRSFKCSGKGNDCSLTIQLSQATEHFLVNHKSVKTNSVICDLSYTSVVEDHSKLKLDIGWPYSLIELDRKSFLGQLYAHDNIFYWTLFCLGTEDEARNYKVKIIFSPKKNAGTSMEWNIPVQPIIKSEQLRDGNEIKDAIIPSCSFKDFKNVAVRDDDISKYLFRTDFIISKSQ